MHGERTQPHGKAIGENAQGELLGPRRQADADERGGGSRHVWEEQRGVARGIPDGVRRMPRIWRGEVVAAHVHPVGAVVPSVVPSLAPYVAIVVEKEGIGDGQESRLVSKTAGAGVIVPIPGADAVGGGEHAFAEANRADEAGGVGGAPAGFEALAAVHQHRIVSPRPPALARPRQRFVQR